MKADGATGECKQLDELDRSRDEQLEWHKYRTNTAGIGKPDGYTNRSFQVSALQRAEGLVLVDDPKEYFHYTRGWLAAVNRSHNEFGWGAVPPEVAVLETRFRDIHQKSAELIIRIAGLIEETHPEIRSFFTQESLASSPIACSYHPTATQQESLAAGHYV
ncbi:MAG: hypothetical protein U0520_03325 [Candidatus Saccharimonadales bacterium]